MLKPHVVAIPADDADVSCWPLSASERFMLEMKEILKARGTPFVKLPTVGSKELDLYTLYQEVYRRGGMGKVVKHKLWKSVAMALHLPMSCTDYGYRLRRHYEKFLLPYEHQHMGTTTQPTVGSEQKEQKRRRRD